MSDVKVQIKCHGIKPMEIIAIPCLHIYQCGVCKTAIEIKLYEKD